MEVLEIFYDKIPIFYNFTIEQIYAYIPIKQFKYL